MGEFTPQQREGEDMSGDMMRDGRYGTGPKKIVITFRVVFALIAVAFAAIAALGAVVLLG
jgi:hypothetical protein